MAEVVWVQVLRAVAALMVAFGHAQEDAARLSVGASPFWPSSGLPWRAGVDLFFVISGFIMVVASAPLFGRPGASKTFLSRRIARIVPLYWLSCTIALGLILASRALSSRWPVPDVVSILGAYLFWPVDTFGDGIARPFNLIGWTLNYEMFFYCVFALAIGAPAGRAVLRVAAALGLLVALGAIWHPAPPAFVFWSSPIVLEFVLGMGLALLARQVALGRAARLALAVSGFALLALDPLASGVQDLDWITPNDASRLLAWGVPSAMLVAAATLGGQAPRTQLGPFMRAGAAIGDASYALYLVHPIVIVATRKAWLALGLGGGLGLWPLVALEIAASIAAALAIHRWVELPLTRRLRGRLADRTGRPVAAPA